MRNLGLAMAVLAIGCGESTCPPDYPVMRDGYCYPEGDGAMLPVDGAIGGMDAAVDSGGGGTDAGMSDMDADVICPGSHPMFDDTNRWCDPGCYCSANDTCYPSDVAAACCEVDVVCGPPAGTDAGMAICNGSHPLLRDTPPQRYCAPGNCYCGDLTVTPPIDSCYPMEVADACCPVDIVCY